MDGAGSFTTLLPIGKQLGLCLPVDEKKLRRKKKMMHNTFAYRPYTVSPRRIRHSTRIRNGPYPQGPPTLHRHFQANPTFEYAPTNAHGLLQPQPAYPNIGYFPNGSYIQPNTSFGVFPNYSYLIQPQPSVGYPSNVYSNCIQPQPTNPNVGHPSKSTTTIKCPFLRLPETIQFSKVLDDP
ncbi:hypothetical protein CDAR_270351 [Caerostris darwini]|uniref:Uncharacterized protein n=1 Tax=Caerostris darwini TaxID=1538125 RepID=A0AAV4NGU0_9ARAC|nr:hypothetical protein CDAR_270351 [Caerostris darwini]